MKVFISHSSGDRWIAEKISEEIRELGIETFLDAQNIETGDDFDEEIRRQLTESDEILIVISAAALKSQWVMMELGAARTLGKRLVLILVGVSPNELPSPVNRHLARDINEIRSYYNELELRQKSTSADEPSATSSHLDSLIAPPLPPRSDNVPVHVGDRVQISERPIDPEGFPVLVEAMEQYLGLNGEIIAEETFAQAAVFRLDVDGGVFFWAERWLKRTN